MDKSGVKSLAMDHVRRLVARSFVVAVGPKNTARRYQLTGKGLKAIGLICCPTCDGAGTVPAGRAPLQAIR